MKSKLLFKVFGWRVYLSRERMQLKPRSRNSARKKAYISLYEATDGHCMECGGEIDWCSGRVYSLLDQTHPAEDRYASGNCRLICPVCNAAYQRANQKGWTETHPAAAATPVSHE